MAREILFKAKRIDNGEWVEGNLMVIKSGEYIVPSDSWFDYGELAYYESVEPSTICQYTGLTDKNGNKIWENDIVKCIDKYGEAEFLAVIEFGNPNSYYSWGYQLRHIKGDEPNLDILLWISMEEVGVTCEVIGNIFDNPELLEG
jgi:uncharacterized phage protein (TIGR01671 family)